MTNPNIQEEEDKPLDPAMENVRRKMVRLLFISSSAIVLALMAVLGSIVYKANKNSTAAKEATAAVAVNAPVAAAQTATLPKGFAIETTTVDGNRIWFMGTGADGKHLMIVHDISTGKTLTEISIVTQ
ncbi:hypothetical protein JJB09_10165 [Rhizobium sp. KVB221]|uniref:Uncharacterized protein n=1 Tax=Rhizobium setariae TaxID=2801340 RepID=A0A936YPD1_9HYPH|nr:hypothetical protein [Rhizobium setariae]MBL0372392.1 hypothetical protein [Rhizobium setariae]